MSKILLEGKHIYKTYKMQEVEVHALKDVSFQIFDGEMIVILGPSGSGKSTLLNIIGGMDTVTSGELYFRGKDFHQPSEKELTQYRRNYIGFVFQFYNLMPNLTALENVELSREIAQDPFEPKDMLNQVGLGDRLNHFPMQMSGGEQQRVAMARALCKNPGILLCDEPTGALDSVTGKEVLQVLQNFNREYKKTVVLITHNHNLAQMADRIFYLKDGSITDVDVVQKPISAEEVVI